MIDGFKVEELDQKEIDRIINICGDTSCSPGNEDRHYDGRIQPIDLIEQQELGFHEANIVKYTCRWKKKGGIQDLEKAAFYLGRLIRFVKAKEAESK